MKTYKAWNGNNWEKFKTFKAACSMLQERFNKSTWNEQRDMDGEQIHINTEEDEYSYAQIEIIKGDFKIRVFR